MIQQTPLPPFHSIFLFLSFSFFLLLLFGLPIFGQFYAYFQSESEVVGEKRGVHDNLARTSGGTAVGTKKKKLLKEQLFFGGLCFVVTEVIALTQIQTHTNTIRGFGLTHIFCLTFFPPSLPLFSM